MVGGWGCEGVRACICVFMHMCVCVCVNRGQRPRNFFLEPFTINTCLVNYRVSWTSSWSVSSVLIVYYMRLWSIPIKIYLLSGFRLQHFWARSYNGGGHSPIIVLNLLVSSPKFWRRSHGYRSDIKQLYIIVASYIIAY